MAEPEQSDKNDNDSKGNTLSMSLGVVKLKLTGKMLGVFLPYAGVSLLVVAVATAAVIIIRALRE